MSRFIVALGLLSAIGCEKPSEVANYDPWGSPRSFPLTKMVKDDRPAFRIDPDKPFRIELGRGSGRDGLETIRIAQDGSVILHRMKEEQRDNVIKVFWQRAEHNLSNESLGKILDAIEANDLMKLGRSYDAGGSDGTQWVLWIKQGEQEKTIYCDNHFPTPIIRFAEQLDAILATSGRNLTWRGVSNDRHMGHDHDLWESIKR
jgi:hypothetical protein